MKRMLNLLLPLLIASYLTVLPLCSLTAIYAMDVTLSWEANTEPDLAGYRIHYKIDPSDPYSDQNKININDPNATTHTVTGLNDSEIYYFILTAYDTSGLESDYSNEVNTASGPRVTSITSFTSDGSYMIGDNIDVTLHFSEVITLADGNLIVTLNTGRSIEITPFTSQSEVHGDYTVQPGENITDLNVNSLVLSGGGTLKNSEGTDCPLSLPTGNNLADNKDIIIDTTAPSVTITYSEPGPYCDADTITITAEFTEAISDTPQIGINYAGTGSDISAADMSSI